MNTELISKVETFVIELLNEKLNPDFRYHNLRHTKTVVEGSKVIGKAENLKHAEMEVLLIAAWFHDTGYVYTIEGHEEESIRIATDFLSKENVDIEIIKKVGNCIRATTFGSTPTKNIEKIICDADMFHLIKDNYEDFATNLRKEWTLVDGKYFNDLEWNMLNLNFLTSHEFKTDSAKNIMSEKKEKIISGLRKTIKKLKKKIDFKLTSELGVSAEELKVLKKKLLKVESRPERGIETMFRLTSKNHIDISGMADSKANILISINTIIISVLLGSLMQKLDNNPHLIIPTIILLMVTLISIVYSVLSLRPNITSGKFSKEDIKNQNVNLLFFGNFHKMERQDYHFGMNRLMENASFLYSNLIDDIFFLGVVLAKKYNYLRIAYTVFMYGIIIAVIFFLVAILFFESNNLKL